MGWLQNLFHRQLKGINPAIVELRRQSTRVVYTSLLTVPRIFYTTIFLQMNNSETKYL